MSSDPSVNPTLELVVSDYKAVSQEFFNIIKARNEERSAISDLVRKSVE